MRLKLFGLKIAIVLATSSCVAIELSAQAPEEPSIADAARQNRQQKKPPTKSGTVITNETLNPSPAPGTNPATAAPEAPQANVNTGNVPQAGTVTDSTAPKSPAQPEISKQDSEKLKAEIAAIKQELKEKQSEVDLLQRLLNLDREALLSKPEPSRDVEGKAKIDAEQDDLNQKVAEFDKLKAKLQSVAPELISPQTPPKS